MNNKACHKKIKLKIKKKKKTLETIKKTTAYNEFCQFLCPIMFNANQQIPDSCKFIKFVIMTKIRSTTSMNIGQNFTRAYISKNILNMVVEEEVRWV